MFVASSNRVAQDWPALSSYLLDRGYQLGPEADIEQFKGGASNFNYLIKLNGERAVLRCPPRGSTPGANDVSREYKVLSGLNEVFSYAPRAIHLCEESCVIGVPFCISEFREGVAIATELPEALETRKGVGAKLAELTLGVLAELHQIDPVACGLADLGRAEGYLERQVCGWGKRAERSLTGVNFETARKVTAWLQQHLPERGYSSLIHNDFKLDNMLIDLDDLSVRAVLDWDMCTLGDPMTDLANLLLYWGQPGDNELYHTMARMPYMADAWPSRRDAFARYLADTGKDFSEAELQFYWVLAIFRLAVVIAQLVVLYDAGTLQSVHVNAGNIGVVRQRLTAMLEEALQQTTEFNW